MRGDPEVIALLNEQLTSELTAINQYFLHAKMQENWGWTKLAAYTRDESIDEMKHAEKLTDRILFLEGLPNYQRLGTLRIGQTVREQLEADLAIEVAVVERLRPGIEMMPREGRRHHGEPLRGDPRRRGAPHRLPRDPARADGASSASSSTWPSWWTSRRPRAESLFAVRGGPPRRPCSPAAA